MSDHLTAAELDALRSARAAARFIGVVLPLVLVVLLAVVLLMWFPRVPNPMATHWNLAGEPDGFSSRWVSLLMFPVIGALLTLLSFTDRLAAMQAKLAPSTPVWGAANRLIAAVVLGAVTLIVVFGAGTTMLQLDLADARMTPNSNGVLIVGFCAAMIVVVVGYLAQPKLVIGPRSAGAEVEPLELSDGGRIRWAGEVAASKPYVWIVSLTMLVTVVVFVLVLLNRSAGPLPLALVALLNIGVFVLVMSGICFHVRIDEHGFAARSVIGWPKIRIDAHDIEQVQVDEISPMGEFGGWGWRWLPGGSQGLVMRTGEGLRITRTNGKMFAVTIDDAAAAAASLTTAVARARETRIEEGEGR